MLFVSNLHFYLLLVVKQVLNGFTNLACIVWRYSTTQNLMFYSHIVHYKHPHPIYLESLINIYYKANCLQNRSFEISISLQSFIAFGIDYNSLVIIMFACWIPIYRIEYTQPFLCSSKKKKIQSMQISHMKIMKIPW